MIYYNKKLNAIFFDEFDLKNIFEAPHRLEIIKGALSSGFSIEELQEDEAKRQKIVDKIEMLNDKEDNEIFTSLYIMSKFYPEGKIGFLLRDNVSIKKNPIKNLVDLKKCLKENDLSDFLLFHSDGYRFFQLKLYREETNVNKLCEFLKKKLWHYGNELGDVNLLVILQGNGDIPENFFEDIHKNMKMLALKGGGHILISYNEKVSVGSGFYVLNTVHPNLGTTRIAYNLS